jgi:hypothetical protein
MQSGRLQWFVVATPPAATCTDAGSFEPRFAKVESNRSARTTTGRLFIGREIRSNLVHDKCLIWLDARCAYVFDRIGRIEPIGSSCLADDDDERLVMISDPISTSNLSRQCSTT